MNNPTSYLSPLPRCCPCVVGRMSPVRAGGCTSSPKREQLRLLPQIRLSPRQPQQQRPNKAKQKNKTVPKHHDNNDHGDDDDKEEHQEDHILNSLERALSIQTSFMSNESRVSSLGSIPHDHLEVDLDGDSSHPEAAVEAEAILAADIASFRSIQTMKKKESRWQTIVVDTPKQDSIPFTPRRKSQDKVTMKGSSIQEVPLLASSPISVSSFHRETTTMSSNSSLLSPSQPPALGGGAVGAGDSAPLPPRRTINLDDDNTAAAATNVATTHVKPTRQRRASCNDTLLSPVRDQYHRQRRRASYDTLPTPPLRRSDYGEDVH